MTSDRDQAILRVAQAYVRDCCRARTPAHVNELAARLQLSRTQVLRSIKRATGMTVAAYLRHLRLAHACVLLKAGLSTTEAAYQSGFGTRGSLFRVLKAELGMTPAEYRRTK